MRLVDAIKKLVLILQVTHLNVKFNFPLFLVCPVTLTLLWGERDYVICKIPSRVSASVSFGKVFATSQVAGKCVCVSIYLFTNTYSGLHKLCYPTIRDRSTWSKFGAHGEHGDDFLFSNLGALWFSENFIRYSLHVCLREVKNNLFSFKHSYLRHFSWRF